MARGMFYDYARLSNIVSAPYLGHRGCERDEARGWEIPGASCGYVYVVCHGKTSAGVLNRSVCLQPQAPSLAGLSTWKSMRTISEAGREICRKKSHNLHNGQLIGTLPRIL